MVHGDQHFRATPCNSKSAIRAKCHETPSRASLALEVGCLRPCGADGAIPHAHEVVHDFRYSGLAD